MEILQFHSNVLPGVDVLVCHPAKWETICLTVTLVWAEMGLLANQWKFRISMQIYIKYNNHIKHKDDFFCVIWIFHTYLCIADGCVFLRRVPLLEQKLLTFHEYMSSPPVFSGVRVNWSLDLYVCFIDRCLSVCPFDHCDVCPSSIYGFWLPLLLSSNSS